MVNYALTAKSFYILLPRILVEYGKMPASPIVWGNLAMNEPDDISTEVAARAEGLAREIAAIVDAKCDGLSAADLDKLLAQKPAGSPIISSFDL